MLHLAILNLLGFSCLCSSTSSLPQVRTAREEAEVLSQEFNQPIQVSASLQNCLVFLQGNGQSAACQIKVLADALSADVITDHGISRVVRTKAGLAELNRSRTETRAQWIEAELAAKANRPTTKVSLQKTRDASKFGEKLIRRIGVRLLAALPPGLSTVFEDQPVFGALSLPGHLDLNEDLIESFQQLQQPSQIKNVLVESAPSVNDSKPTNGFLSIKKCRVTCWSGPNFLNIVVRVFGQEGQTLASSEFFPSPYSAPLIQKDFNNRYSSGHENHRVALRPESVEAVKFIETNEASIPNWVLHPENHEPLDIFVRDVIAALGDRIAPNKCFAIEVTDEMWKRALACVQNNTIDTDVFRGELEEWLRYETLDSPFSIVMRPMSVEDAEFDTSNRKVLGKFARSMVRSPHPRTIARLFCDNYRCDASLGSAWLRLAQSGSVVPLGQDASPEFYRLLGSISDEKWDALLANGHMTAGELGIVEAVDDYLKIDFPLRDFKPQPHTDILRFGPENVPNGLPETAEVLLHSANEEMVKFCTLGQPIPKVWEEFPGFPTYLSNSRSIESASDMSLRYALDRKVAEQSLEKWAFMIGTRPTIVFEIRLSKSQSIVQTVHGNVTSHGNIFKYADLPQQQKDEFWNQALVVEERYAVAHPPIDLAEVAKQLKGKNTGTPPP